MNSKAKNRPKRTPVGSRRALWAKDRPGFSRRWVNDQGDRVSMFREAGYNPVTEDADESDTSINSPSKMGSVSRKSVGGDMYAVLMEVPEEFYREDQQVKQDYVDEIESGFDPTGSVKDATYGNQIKKIHQSNN